MCMAIVVALTVQGHLFEGMYSAVVFHTKMVGQLIALWQRCLPPCSPCSDAHLVKHSGWRLWIRCLPSSRSRWSGAHALRTLLRGFVTWSLGHLQVGFNWPIAQRRPSGNFEWSRWSTSRWTLSWRACRTLPPGSGMSYPVPRKREQSLHTCAQDVQITRIVTIW
jgi:hypothetical protein